MKTTLNILSVTFLLLSLLTAPLSSSAATHVMNKSEKTTEKALFAGGCFWCMEKPFESLPGVFSVVSGYSMGQTKNPTYKNYGAGGHLEVVEITFDPKRVTYAQLLEVFWQQINPTDAGGQFVDRGYAYSSGIFYLNEQQRQLAEASKLKLQQSKRFAKPIVTPIKPGQQFYAAETYHQDYYIKNPVRYWYYRSRSGRDQFLDKSWGKDRLEHTSTKKGKVMNLIEKLTPLQYKVTQEEGTEPPFDNEYWDNKKVGIYVDIVSAEVLFSSTHKYKSGTGWPSFDRPLVAANILEKEDKGLFSSRTEVRSREGNSHLGHLFNDGPKSTGLRYCINSASLRFIPVAELSKEGYGQFLPLFNK